MTLPIDWCLSSPGALRACDWGDAVAIYNPLSGSTHLLDEVNGALVSAIAAGISNERKLLALLEAMIEYPEVEAAIGDLGQRLSDLFDIGLIEPSDHC